MVSNTQRASTGFSIRSIFTAIGRFFGIARTSEPPQPVLSEQEQAALQIRNADYNNLPIEIKSAGREALEELCGTHRYEGGSYVEIVWILKGGEYESN